MRVKQMRIIIIRDMPETKLKRISGRRLKGWEFRSVVDPRTMKEYRWAELHKYDRRKKRVTIITKHFM